MASQLVKDLIDAGVHFGHRVSRWNPKMKPYIFGKRNLIHIIDVKETVRGLLLGKRFLAQLVAGGKDVLLVGTKRQARRVVETQAERVGMHRVTDRWLGGTLTNFREIRKRISRLEELEKLEAEGNLDAYSKKEGASLRREMRKIQRNLGGIRNMNRLPGALLVIDQKHEIIAVREAIKMHIPVVCLMDTDADPDLVDIPIPGNDDAMRAIELIIARLCDSIAEGMKGRVEQEETGEEQPAPRRRSRRPTTARAQEPAEPQPTTEPGAEQTPTTPEKPPVPAARPVTPAAPGEPAEAPKPPAEDAEKPADQAEAPQETPAEAPASSDGSEQK